MPDKGTFRRFFIYAFFAGVATVIDMGVLYVLTSMMGMHYLISAVWGYGAGMLTNYSLNKVYTFKNTSTRYALQMGIFILVALVGLALNQIIMYALVEFGSAHYLVAKVVAVGVVALWSFWGHKRFTFGMVQ